MSGVATAIAGSAIVGGIVASNAAGKQASAARDAAQMQSDAATKSAQIQSDSAAAALAAQKEALEKQTALNKPFYDVGVNAVNKLSNRAPYLTDTFNFQEDPGYAFRFNEGMKGLNATAAARGGLISGNALRAATGFGQDMASQEYQNAYNRYLTGNAQKLQEYNTNMGLDQYLTNVGQASANKQTNALGVYGTNSANAITGAANANAAGITGAANAGAAGITGAANAGAAGMVGSANALTSGLGTGLNYYQNQNMLNSFNNRSAYNNLSNQYGANNVFMPDGYGARAPIGGTGFGD
jgi:hypothetical protein